MRKGRMPGRIRRRLLITALVCVLVAGMLGLWTAAPSGSFAGSGRTAVGWVGEHVFTVAGVAVLIGIAGLVTPFVLAWLQRGWSRGDASASDQRRRARDRGLMVKRVRNRWIKGVLEQSLADEARIRLGLTRRLDAIQRPDMLIRRSGGQPEPLPAGVPVSAVFEEAGGALLILGAPGSGKTTALLELTRDLLDQAAADDTRPLPVVCNLSSWADQRAPLREWLIDELRKRYDVPRSIARRWVDTGEILPLLDGLDEVAVQHRAACVEAINAFRNEHGLVPFAVCSRTEEYSALAARLRVEDAVELLPPTRQQIHDYLQATGTSLADVRAALAADPTLWELLQSPLVLSIVALTYGGQPAAALRAPGTPEQRLTLLFEAYTERMLTHRPGRYTPTQTRAWLAWLARSMRDRAQTEFHLDRLDADWLPTKTQRRFATLLPIIAVGLGIGLASGLVSGLSPDPTFWGLPSEEPSFRGLVNGLFSGLSFGLAGRLRSRLIAGLIAALITGIAGMIIITGLGLGLVVGLSGATSSGLLVGLIAGLTKAEPVERMRWSWRQAAFGLPYLVAVGLSGVLVAEMVTGLGLSGVLVVGMGAALIVVLSCGLVSELTDQRSNPNEGIHKSARCALAFGVGGCWLFGGLVWMTIPELAGGLVGALLIGLVCGLVIGLVLGGLVCIRHLVLRGMLAFCGYAPVRSVRFLDEAASRLLLRRVGSGYIFVHRMLLDHFAELEPVARSNNKALTSVAGMWARA